MQRKDSFRPPVRTKKEVPAAKKRMRLAALPVRLTPQLWPVFTREIVVSEIEHTDPVSYWFQCNLAT